MNWFLRSRVRLVLLGLGLGISLVGCSQQPANTIQQYVPTPEAARKGVTLVMDNWVKGLSPKESGSASNPQIHVVDETRKADQRPIRYEIIGEVSVENARGFAVRVTYNGSDEPEIVRFVALGVDPMWLFRKEDFDSIWAHSEEVPADRAGEPYVSDDPHLERRLNIHENAPVDWFSQHGRFSDASTGLGRHTMAGDSRRVSQERSDPG